MKSFYCNAHIVWNFHNITLLFALAWCNINSIDLLHVLSFPYKVATHYSFNFNYGYHYHFYLWLSFLFGTYKCVLPLSSIIFSSCTQYHPSLMLWCTYPNPPTPDFVPNTITFSIARYNNWTRSLIFNYTLT